MMDLKAQIAHEIGHVQTDIDNQKRTIKHHTAQGLDLVDAERKLKELLTHLNVLKANLTHLNERESDGTRAD